MDEDTKRNLKFLLDIRHEIEHRMTSRIDEAVSAKLLACCLNFNRVLKELFGPQYGLDGDLSFALQFSAIDFDQRKALMAASELPPAIEAVRARHEDDLTDEQYNDPRYAYRVLFVPKTVNKKGRADRVIEFVKPSSEEAEAINRIMLKEVEKEKFKPGQIVAMMTKAGFKKFSLHFHAKLWKDQKAKEPGKGYGVKLSDGQWYWYQRWVDEVRQHCEVNREKYT